MPMRYLNIRSTLPIIGMRIQYNSLESGIHQPRYEQETQQARSNRGVTQPKLSIDSYPSRHSYGYTNHTDFARENLERGMSEVRKGTSKHTQMAWALAEDGPKPGRQVGIEFAKRDMENRMTQQRQLVAAAIPDRVCTTIAGALRPTCSRRAISSAGSARGNTMYVHNRSH